MLFKKGVVRNKLYIYFQKGVMCIKLDIYDFITSGISVDIY
jgi:hypothetical protein